MLQLEQRIKKELEENPVLELEENDFSAPEEENPNDLKTKEDADNEEFSVDDYINDEDEPSYRYETNNFSKDEKIAEIPYSESNSFHEYLQEQIAMVMLNEEDSILAEQIIGNIDEDGYLRRELEAIVDDVAFARNILTNEKKLSAILRIIHELDPAGVGARDLRECLMIQLSRKGMQRVEVRLAYRILEDTFEEFTKKHYDKIQRKFNIDEDDLRDAIDEILKLNPKPGSSFSNNLNKGNQTIIPDFILEIARLCGRSTHTWQEIAMAEHRLAPMVDQLGDDEVQLQVGRCFLGMAADEAAGFGEVGGQHAVATRTPLEQAAEHAPTPPNDSPKDSFMRGALTTMMLSR